MFLVSFRKSEWPSGHVINVPLLVRDDINDATKFANSLFDKYIKGVSQKITYIDHAVCSCVIREQIFVSFPVTYIMGNEPINEDAIMAMIERAENV